MPSRERPRPRSARARARSLALALALALAPPAGAGRLPYDDVPPMGWNPCNGFQCHMSAIGEAALRAVADAIAASGLRDAGYRLFSLDDGFQGPRAPDGTLTANASAFPSGTLAPLAAHLSALGLALGAYTDRGQLTCERYSGAAGREAADLATLAGWGVTYLKEDSCNASEVEADRRAEYGLMSAAAERAGVFLSVCGWAPTYAAFGALDPPIGRAWRLGPDAGPFARFLLGLEGAAGASAFAGPGRGWPDCDMLAGDGPAREELLRLGAVAVTGSVLLLSWDVRNASATTLPLAAYTNPELVAVHQDAPARGAPYFARVHGGPATGAAGAVPLAAGLPCGAPGAQWQWAPAPGGGGGGTLESLGAPGMCLAAWDLIPGGQCHNPINAYLLPCANATAPPGQGCPAGAFAWLPGGAEANYSLQVLFEPPSAPSAPTTPSAPLRVNPWPGSLLTDSGVSGAFFLQPAAPPGSAGAARQQWRTAAARGGAAAVVTIEGAGGGCLGAAPAADDNVWARWLAGGDVALLLVNLRVAGAPAAPVACSADCLASLATSRGRAPPAGGWRVRDVHARTDNGTVAAGDDLVTPPLEAGGGSVLLRLTPMP